MTPTSALFAITIWMEIVLRTILRVVLLSKADEFRDGANRVMQPPEAEFVVARCKEDNSDA